MSTTLYSFQAGAVSPKLILTTSTEGLLVIENLKPRVIPWAKFRRVQLGFDPTRFDKNRYRCRLFMEDGAVLTIFSTTFKSLGNFEAQDVEYFKFIEALHDHLQRYGSGVAFGGGVGGARYTLNAIAAVFGFVVFSLVLLIGGLAAGPLFFIPLILWIFLARAVWKWFAINRGEAYDPRKIPAKLLPDIGDAAIVTLEAEAPAVTAASSASATVMTATPTAVKPGTRRYRDEDFGPIAEPGDQSWYGVAGTKTHWADAERYAAEANAKLDAGLIGPPADPPPQGEQSL